MYGDKAPALHVVKLDVGDDMSIAKAAKKISLALAERKESGINLLVNNAAILEHFVDILI